MSDRPTIVATLRFLANGWLESEDDRAWVAEVADEIERREPENMMTCPLCEEVACDEGCPMEEHRREFYE